MMKPAPPDRTPRAVYLGVKGSVIALDASSGAQLWATHLKGSGFVHVVLDGDQLYATTYGEVFCLDPKNGEGRWHNPLKGFGLGLVSIATESNPSSSLPSAAAQHRQQQAAASCAATTAT